MDTPSPFTKLICPCGGPISQLPSYCPRCGNQYHESYGQVIQKTQNGNLSFVTLQKQSMAPPQQEHPPQNIQPGYVQPWSSAPMQYQQSPPYLAPQNFQPQYPQQQYQVPQHAQMHFWQPQYQPATHHAPPYQQPQYQPIPPAANVQGGEQYQQQQPQQPTFKMEATNETATDKQQTLDSSRSFGSGLEVDQQEVERLKPETKVIQTKTENTHRMPPTAERRSLEHKCQRRPAVEEEIDQAQRARPHFLGRGDRTRAPTLDTHEAVFKKQDVLDDTASAEKSSTQDILPPRKNQVSPSYYKITDRRSMKEAVIALRSLRGLSTTVPLPFLQTQWKIAVRRGDTGIARRLLLRIAHRLDSQFPQKMEISEPERTNSKVVYEDKRDLPTTDTLESVKILSDTGRHSPGFYTRKQIVDMCMEDDIVLPTFGMDPGIMEDWLAKVVMYPPKGPGALPSSETVQDVQRLGSRSGRATQNTTGGMRPLLGRRPSRMGSMLPMLGPRPRKVLRGHGSHDTFRQVFYVPEQPIPVPSTIKPKEKRKLNAAKKNRRTPRYAPATWSNPYQKDNITDSDGVEANSMDTRPSALLKHLTVFKAWADVDYLPHRELYEKFLKTRLRDAGQGLVQAIKTHPKLLEKNPRLNEQIIRGTVEVLLEQYTAAINKLFEIYERFQPVRLRQNRPHDWLLLFHAFKPAIDQAAEEYDEIIVKIISEIPSEIIKAAQSSDVLFEADNAPVGYALHLDVIFGASLPGYATKQKYEMKQLSFPDPFITYARAYASIGHEAAMSSALAEEAKYKRSKIMPTEAK